MHYVLAMQYIGHCNRCQKREASACCAMRSAFNVVGKGNKKTFAGRYTGPTFRTTGLEISSSGATFRPRPVPMVGSLASVAAPSQSLDSRASPDTVGSLRFF